MNGELGFELGKHPVKGVSGVGNVKLGIFLIRKQVGQVVFQTQVGAPNVFVGIRRPVAASNYGLLIDESFVFCVPIFQQFAELFFVAVCQLKDDHSQVYSGQSFRSSGQILGDRLHLMELANLHRFVFKHVG